MFNMKKRSMIILGIIVLVVIVLAVFLFVIFAPPKFSDEGILKDPSAAMTFCQESPAQNTLEGQT